MKTESQRENENKLENYDENTEYSGGLKENKGKLCNLQKQNPLNYKISYNYSSHIIASFIYNAINYLI